MVPRLIVDAGARDFAACFGFLISGKGGATDDEIAALARSVGSDRTAVAGMSLRTLFDALLQVFGREKKGDILFSAATIEDMPAIAEINGFRVVPVDLNLDSMLPDAETVARAICPDTRALVVAQLYGCRGDLSALGKICKTHGVLLIEDIAQSFDGTYLGSPHADVVLLSFGPIKRFTAFGGGILLARDKSIAEAVRQRMRDYPVSPRLKYLRRALKMFALRLCSWRPLYSALWSAIRLSGKSPNEVIGRLARGFSGERPGVFQFRPSDAQLAFMAHRFRNALRIKSSVRAARAQSARNSTYRGLFVPGRNVTGMGEWIFPVVAEQPDRLVSFLNAAGYDATRGTTSMRTVRPSTGAKDKRAAAADRLLHHAVYLPVHALRSDREFESLANSVNEGMSHHARA